MTAIPANHLALHALGMCSRLTVCLACKELSSATPAAELPPDPEHMNDERAEWAGDALKRFTAEHGEEAGGTRQNLVDLLTDLAHYCDRHELDFALCLRMAKTNYSAETDDFGTQYNGVVL